MLRLVTAMLITMAILSGCSRRDASGEYLSRFSNAIYRLQLVSATDGKLTGQLDTVVRDKDNNLIYSSFIASGIADGSSLSLTLSGSGVLAPHLSASGTFGADTLSLTGNLNGLSTIVFGRVIPGRYQSEVKALTQETDRLKVQRLIAEMKQKALQDQEKFASTLKGLVASARKFEAQANAQLSRWPKAEEQFRAATAQMTSYFARQESLDKNRFSVQRGQINVAINQIAVEAEQLRNQVDNLRSTFGSNIRPLNENISQALNTCKSLGASGNGDVKNACGQLSQEAPAFAAKYETVNQGLARLEAVFQEEKKKQDAIVSQSDRAD